MAMNNKTKYDQAMAQLAGLTFPTYSVAWGDPSAANATAQPPTPKPKKTMKASEKKTWAMLVRAAKENLKLTCTFDDDDDVAQIEKARVYMDSNDSRLWICHNEENEFDGNPAPDKLGYKYSWVVKKDTESLGESVRMIKDLVIHEPKVIDFNTCLDKVVLPAADKAEILACLSQAKHATKLFEEWGIKETIKYGLGMTFLFYGGPGTGKTFTANCIAEALGKELQVVKLGEIQSSMMGDTPRNIEEAFRKAKANDNVLLIDEADSLIGSRDNLGMILGGEVNTLLQEIEQFEGILILTTNRIGDLDEALERRISLIVEYKNPDEEARREIFKQLIPSKMPLDEDVDHSFLAEYPLTGGQIKNVVLFAARLAAAEEAKSVTRVHFHSAIKRTVHSSGRMGTKRRPMSHVRVVGPS